VPDCLSRGDHLLRGGLRAPTVEVKAPPWPWLAAEKNR
jgi:hypothetical protein